MIEFKVDILTTEDEPSFEMPVERVNFIREVGTHCVRILSITEVGLAPKDPNWFRLDIVYATPDDAQIKTFLYVPIAGTLHYGEKKSNIFGKVILNWVKALGIKPETMVDGAGAYRAIMGLLRDPQKLVGCIMNISVDYDGNFVKSFKKEDGSYEQRAFNKDGSPMVGVGPFPSFDAVKIYQAQSGMMFSGLKVMDVRPLSSFPNEMLLKNIAGENKKLWEQVEGNSPF
jgi:hypothetical protein